MKVVTANEMRKIDKKAIEEWGISGCILMENAGAGIVKSMEKYSGDLKGKRIIIMAGKGNNGGDGFVIARHLLNREIHCEVFILVEEGSLKGDALLNYSILKKTGCPIFEITSRSMLSSVAPKINEADIIIDALLGTGLTHSAEGIIAEAIDLINSTHKCIISVDIPSGMNSDTGEITGPAIKASLTFTLCLPKRSFFLYPAANYTGKFEVVDIGIPQKLIEMEDIKVELIDSNRLKILLVDRNRDTHKGNFGHVLILSGSPGKTGAATLSAMGALRCGTGLVTVGIPESLNDIMEIKLTEAMTEPLAETEARTLSLKAKEKILDMSKRMNAVAIGPGLSLHPETSELVRELIQLLEIPVIIDADGITALKGHENILKRTKAPVILTPHPGEMSRLINKEINEIRKDRIGIVQNFCCENRVFMALKGANTIIGDPEGNCYINPTGNPGMASGGSGDVLTGMIAGFIAQKMNPLDGLIAGVFIHGISGDIALDSKGEEGLIASDIIDSIPVAIKKIKAEIHEKNNISLP